MSRQQLTEVRITLKCLNIGTPKTFNFPFVPKGKLMVLGVPIFENIVIRLYCAQILRHIKTINFTFRTNESLYFGVSQYIGTLRVGITFQVILAI